MASPVSPVFDTGPLQQMLSDPNLALLADEHVTSESDRLNHRVRQLTEQLDAARDAPARKQAWPSSTVRHLLVAAAAFGVFVMLSQMRAQSALAGQFSDQALDLRRRLATSASEMGVLFTKTEALAAENQRLELALRDATAKLAYASEQLQRERTAALEAQQATATPVTGDALVAENRRLVDALKDANQKLADANSVNGALRRECAMKPTKQLDETDRPAGLLETVPEKVADAVKWLKSGSGQTGPTRAQVPNQPAKRRSRTK